MRRPERADHIVLEAQTAEGGVLWSLGLEEDAPRVGCEPSAQVFSSHMIACFLQQLVSQFGNCDVQKYKL